jgi:hypothetical protein
MACNSFQLRTQMWATLLSINDFNEEEKNEDGGLKEDSKEY